MRWLPSLGNDRDLFTFSTHAFAMARIPLFSRSSLFDTNVDARRNFGRFEGPRRLRASHWRQGDERNRVEVVIYVAGVK
jgi:hypothetical protein